MRERRCRQLCGTLLLVAALTACDGSAADRVTGAGPGSRADTTAGRAAPGGRTGPAERTHTIDVRPVLRLHTSYALGPVALQDGEAAVPAAPARSGADWDRVAVLEPGARRLRVVARSEFARGLINWVAVSGDWVAWVDQSRRQSDTDPDVLWRVHAEDLRTHEVRLLASNGDAADPFVPQVHGAPAGVFWSQAERDRSARERFWEPGADAPVDLMRHSEMTPGSESLAHGAVVFLGPSALPHRGHTTGGDCWRVTLDGHEVEPLTRTGLAMGCAAAGDHLTWTEHVDPEARFLPADGVLDDPYEVRVRPLDGGPGRLLHRGYLAMGSPVSGDGFTVWPTANGSLRVTSLTGRAHRVVQRGAGPSSRAAGNALAFVRADAGGDTLEVVRVGARVGRD